MSAAMIATFLPASLSFGISYAPRSGSAPRDAYRAPRRRNAALCAALAEPLHAPLARCGARDDNEDPGRLVARLQLVQHLLARRFREMHVEQHQIRPRLAREVEAARADGSPRASSAPPVAEPARRGPPAAS